VPLKGAKLALPVNTDCVPYFKEIAIMTHQPIQIHQLSFALPHKTCFDDFNTLILPGSRFAIIGRNGSGKTSLLHCLCGIKTPSSGTIKPAHDIIFGLVPQIINNHDNLSGSQRFHRALTAALKLEPQVLLLDEPTNHLDQHHRQQLTRMLQSYQGTLIMVSHDTELLRQTVTHLWHIDNGKINEFHGAYDDYLRETQQQRTTIEQQIARLNKQKQMLHEALMKEEQRAAKSKIKGEKSIAQRKWPTIVSASKANRGAATTGRHKSTIRHQKQELSEARAQLYLPDVIMPTFSIETEKVSDYTILSIVDGSIQYAGCDILLSPIHLSMNSKEHIAILGNNASGKSSLLKALLNDPSIITTGQWQLPKQSDIGYLDQHYANLNPEKTVFESIAELKSTWTDADIRQHLNTFLFRKNEAVHTCITALSGGEKARLSLAHIAATTPKLLILDEITNNLDLETKHHVIQVLKSYPGALIIVSHDTDFLAALQIHQAYQIQRQQLFFAKPELIIYNTAQSLYISDVRVILK